MSVRSYINAHPQAYFWSVAGGLYLLWWLGYEHGLRPDGRLDQFLSEQVAAAAAWSLRAAGFAAGTAPGAPHIVTMLGQPAVLVGAACNGLVLYALFIGFVLAYPDNGRRGGWFMLAGVVALYLINVARVAALALNHTYWYHTVDFNHHYTFTFVAYAAILSLWAWWARERPASAAPYEPTA